jgi:hypothetical protein
VILSFRAKFSGAEHSRGISRCILSTASGNSERFFDFVLLQQNFARNHKRERRATTS